MANPSRFWTHPSVLKLPAADDPVGYISHCARVLVLNAIEAGWAGPPYDPFALADHLQLPVVPREDILDARTVPLEEGGLQIEFNPNRPRGRIRYSLAHELAHTLFPDCRERIRNRAAREHMKKDDWQLEMLCNIAAAELLMPIGSFPDLKDRGLTIDSLMDLRREYDVSTEAMLLRVVRLTEEPCSVFSASRDESPANGHYQIDYAVSSKAWAHAITSGAHLPSTSIVAECTAIGFTAKGDEEWPGISGILHVEDKGMYS